MRNFVIIALLLIFAGCRTIAPPGDESLVESRIIAAVNAERNRFAAELSQKLGAELRLVDERVNAVEGGLQQVAVAAEEYRRFVLSIIDGLQSAGQPIPNGTYMDDTTNTGVSDLDSAQDNTNNNRP